MENYIMLNGKKILVSRLDEVMDKLKEEEEDARTEPYLKKRKIYRAVPFDSVFRLDEFLQKKSREGHNFTVVKVMVTPNSRYSLVYYEEE